jgi:hypothetical protein
MLPFVFASLVRRYMKFTANYHAMDEEGLQEGIPIPDLEEGESLLGWYQNPAPHQEHVLFFTSTSIIARDPNQTTRVRAEDIVNYHAPASKTEATGVHLETKEGPRFIRIAGHHSSGSSDAFCLVPLVHAMLGPSRREPPQRTE